MIGTVFAVLAVAAIVTSMLFYRKKQFEKELLAANWKINYEDIMFSKDNVVGGVPSNYMHCRPLTTGNTLLL